MQRNLSLPKVKRANPIPPGKENFKISSSRKESIVPKIVSTKNCRNPLSDLGNVETGQKLDPGNKTVQSNNSRVSSLVPVKPKRRSNSAGSIEKNTGNPLLNAQNITDRSEAKKVLDNLNLDEVFIDGKQHALTFAHTSIDANKSLFRRSIPSLENSQFQNSSLPVARLRRSSGEPRQKCPERRSTLVKRRRSSAADIFANNNCLYDSDFFQDNFRYMLDTEGKFVFRKSYLVKFIDNNSRYSVVSWLEYLHQLLEVPESVFFMSTRMLDHVLIMVKITTEKYFLVGIACLWIAIKYLGCKFILAPKLFSLCGGRYSRNQIINMEREILKLLQYKLCYPDPCSFLFYFLKMQKLETNKIVRLSTMFLLEIFCLFPDVSSFAPSILASSALYLSLERLNINSTGFVNYIDSFLLEADLFKRNAQRWQSMVFEILKVKSICAEIVKKYSLLEEHNVSKYFLQ